jgi:hypothetical protein
VKYEILVVTVLSMAAFSKPNPIEGMNNCPKGMLTSRTSTSELPGRADCTITALLTFNKGQGTGVLSGDGLWCAAYLGWPGRVMNRDSGQRKNANVGKGESTVINPLIRQSPIRRRESELIID